MRSRAVPWTVSPGGVALAVRLTPRGGRDAIEGVEQLADGHSAFKVKVRAAPSDGEANDALIRLVARALAVAPRDVVLAGGATSRLKRLTIAGDGPTLAVTLEKISGV